MTFKGSQRVNAAIQLGYTHIEALVVKHLEEFTKIIDEYYAEGKYRVFNDIVRTRGNFPHAIW